MLLLTRPLNSFSRCLRHRVPMLLSRDALPVGNLGLGVHLACQQCDPFHTNRGLQQVVAG
jgi:hypothetical protein